MGDKLEPPARRNRAAIFNRRAAKKRLERSLHLRPRVLPSIGVSTASERAIRLPFRDPL